MDKYAEIKVDREGDIISVCVVGKFSKYTNSGNGHSMGLSDWWIESPNSTFSLTPEEEERAVQALYDKL